MAKRKNPAGGNRQGFGNSSRLSSAVITAAPRQDQQEFQAAAWLAARAGVAVETAKLFAELHNFGGRQ